MSHPKAHKKRGAEAPLDLRVGQDRPHRYERDQHHERVRQVLDHNARLASVHASLAVSNGP